MSLRNRHRCAFSLLELSLALVIVAMLTVVTMTLCVKAWNHGRDAAVARHVTAVRHALCVHVLETRGVVPASAEELRPILGGAPGRDPLTWSGSRGSGRIVFDREGGLALADHRGKRPVERDSRGRSYATY
ncbi:MAG: prepilin-type N-terminal cleavage/methylation domain-containing protein [Candidatus Riflebacteria bacterium]|nr:prepilin-type N-terminal cleavage/methylation domain-containing protein [Candidatus Riflebacteria bacterium]